MNRPTEDTRKVGDFLSPVKHSVVRKGYGVAGMLPVGLLIVIGALLLVLTG